LGGASPPVGVGVGVGVRACASKEDRALSVSGEVPPALLLGPLSDCVLWQARVTRRFADARRLNITGRQRLVQLGRGRKRTSSSSLLFRQEGDRTVPPRRRWSIRSAACTDAECRSLTRDHLSSCRPRGGAPLTNLCPFHQPEVAATQPRAPRGLCRPRRPPAAATPATTRPLPPTACRASPSGGRASSFGGHASHGCGAQSPLRPLLRP